MAGRELGAKYGRNVTDMSCYKLDKLFFLTPFHSDYTRPVVGVVKMNLVFGNEPMKPVRIA